MKTATAFVALFFAMMTVAFAQSPTQNLALTATASHSGGGTTTYGATNYNDGVITASGVGCAASSTPWGWVTAPTGWIEFDWTSTQTVGEITFYYGQTCSRYLQSGIVQYWDGAAFVNWYNFAFPDNTTWVRTFQFAPVSTTKLRIYMPAGSVTGSQASNPSFREIEIRNVCTDPATTVSFTTPPTVEKPGNVNIQYSIYRPIGTFNATLTFNFYTPTNTLVYSTSTVVPYTGTLINGTYVVASSNLPVGYYRLEVTFNVLNICGKLEDVVSNQIIMVVNQGTVPCIVWPGDVNNDGICNYSDRAALNRYIFDANLRALWLTGPTRYRADAATNPLTYFKWEAQPAIPWNTAEGCYMDTDGNGVINAFDYIAIKLNLMKTHAVSTPKSLIREDFSMIRIYPNPFNPSTNVQYRISERSNVTLEVVSMEGTLIVTLATGVKNIGEYMVPFDGSNLSSGTYMVRIVIQGLESGMTFNHAEKIVLSK